MSDWLPAVAFREPLWLLLAPLCWALPYWWRRAAEHPQRYRAYADPGLLKWLIVAPRRKSASWLPLLAWLLIVVAISGPMLADQHETRTRGALDIAVILDISPSMRAGDVAPDRLQRARLELNDLLLRLRGDRVALVAFSAHAYPVLPLTDDLAVIPWYLDALDPALTRHAGSNVVPALELAARMLDRDGRARAIVLLSDGGFPDSAEALAAADRLARRDIPVFALGVGTAHGAPVPATGGFQRDRDGAIVVSRLDRALLAQIAVRTNGRYADLRADGGGWEPLVDGLAALAGSVPATHASATGLPLWPWLLIAGLALLIAPQVRAPRPALPAFMLTAGIAALAAPMSADASPWAERAAYEALTAGRHAEAETRYRDIDGFNGRLGAGAAAYRLDRWREAAEYFADAGRQARDDGERAIAAYNRGTALARLGRFDEALRAFDETLALEPNHARAALNRDIIGRALRGQGDLPGDGRDGRRREDADAQRFDAAGAFDDEAAGGPRLPDDDRGAGSRGGGRAQVIARPLPGGHDVLQAGGLAGEAALAALARLDAVDDRAAEALRHRFLLMDANRPRAAEAQPW